MALGEELLVRWRDRLVSQFQKVRATTEALCAPLSEADQQVQSMPTASPAKWHRAHTTWFFETFILQPAGHAPFDPGFGELFNSYYTSVGKPFARDLRGLITRPDAARVSTWRARVDELLVGHLGRVAPPQLAEVLPRVALGIAHEEQHQELILTDILHALFQNPLGPAYRDAPAPAAPDELAPMAWHTFEGGVVRIGTDDGPPAGSLDPTEPGFSFDNERPRHRVYLEPYALASRPVSVGEVRAFVEAGGYRTPSLWQAEGFALASARGWNAPKYTRVDGEGWRVFTLHGWRWPGEGEPASHLSFWEAEAIARFLGARLPTEAEWEHAARAACPTDGHFADGPLVPRARPTPALGQLFGDVWEWTRSSHDPYPGYRPPGGAFGEYNAKFMANQLVLRGGSCLTPAGHVRSTYRNFWPAQTRYQMAGLRLARSLF